MNQAHTDSPREIRLALVCFGGVSLAVYMAGITREIQHLVEASNALDAKREQTLTGTRAAYAAALTRRAERDGLPTRVVVDVIAGTSAGGIDGIFLAKALATGADQAPLRQIWLEQGDIGQLFRGRGPLPLRVVRFLAGAALGRSDVLAPLDGDLLLRHAYQGLRAMNPQSKRDVETLVVRDGTMDLFVTVTDVTGRVRSASVTDSDAPTFDRTHRYVLRFSAPLTRGQDSTTAGQLGADYDAALAFAARTTSSFPGAFPQVRIDQVREVLRKEAPREADAQVEVMLRELFHDYTLEGEDPRLSNFFDGGVLDNFPFEHAIAAIQGKPAGSEVERYLVVLHPDPGAAKPQEATASGREAAEAAESPGLLATLLSGLIGVRTHEPVLDDLFRLRASNERLQRVDRLVRRHGKRVQAVLDNLDHPVTVRSRYAEIQAATYELHQRAESETGIAWPHYQDLRMDAIVDLLEKTTCRTLDYPKDSRHAAFVRSLLRRLVVQQPGQEHLGDDPDVSDDFLRRYDLPLRERRLRLTVQAVNAQYRSGDVPRALLDATKATLYAQLERLWSVPVDVGKRAGPPPALRREQLSPWLGRDVPDFVAEHHDTLRSWIAEVGEAIEESLGDFSEQSWTQLATSLESWPAGPAAGVVRAFVGFPLWDVGIFPIIAASDVQQFTPVRMRRISPVDAKALRPDKRKLLSIPLHHFAGFLKREYRENDYVWGRLDAAECLLLLVDETTSAPDLADAFDAVVEAESDLDVLRRKGPENMRAFLTGAIRGLRETGSPSPESRRR